LRDSIQKKIFIAKFFVIYAKFLYSDSFFSMSKFSTSIPYPIHLVSESIIQTLLYFDIFQYPLKKEEIYACNRVESLSERELFDKLEELVAAKMIEKREEFYALSFDNERLEKRKSNNERAKKSLPLALKIARFIAFFPYVRAVFISGSLSKGVMQEDGDMDFFIITKPGRLWIARTLLIAFRKIFLFNSHKYFCVNYFVDEDNLMVVDKNLFTATEIASLIPAYGKEYYPTFLKTNNWYRAYYPNFPQRDMLNVPLVHTSFFTKIIEFLLNGAIGNYLDTAFMRITFHHRQKKFHYMSPQDFEIALKTRKYVAKHHPSHFQQKVANALVEKIKTWHETTGIEIKNPF
jgi:hypothetical protein